MACHRVDNGVKQDFFFLVKNNRKSCRLLNIKNNKLKSLSQAILSFKSSTLKSLTFITYKYLFYFKFVQMQMSISKKFLK